MAEKNENEVIDVEATEVTDAEQEEAKAKQEAKTKQDDQKRYVMLVKLAKEPKKAKEFVSALCSNETSEKVLKAIGKYLKEQKEEKFEEESEEDKKESDIPTAEIISELTDEKSEAHDRVIAKMQLGTGSEVEDVEYVDITNETEQDVANQRKQLAIAQKSEDSGSHKNNEEEEYKRLKKLSDDGKMEDGSEEEKRFKELFTKFGKNESEEFFFFKSNSLYD